VVAVGAVAYVLLVALRVLPRSRDGEVDSLEGLGGPGS